MFIFPALHHEFGFCKAPQIPITPKDQSKHPEKQSIIQTKSIVKQCSHTSAQYMRKKNSGSDPEQ